MLTVEVVTTAQAAWIVVQAGKTAADVAAETAALTKALAEDAWSDSLQDHRRICTVLQVSMLYTYIYIYIGVEKG